MSSRQINSNSHYFKSKDQYNRLVIMTSKVVPKVMYKVKVYTEEAKMKDNLKDRFVVENVIRVIAGTLEEVLHLIGYSYLQIKKINRQLAITYPHKQKTEFELSYSENQIPDEIKNGRPTRAHIVEWEKQLYGVIVDEGIARICGQISTTIGKMVDGVRTSVTERGVRVIDSERVLQNVSEEEQQLLVRSGKHFVMVSEKGWLFVVTNTGQEGHQCNKNLTLVLGHGFVVFDHSKERPINWIRTKQELREERRESTRLEANQSIMVSFAAVCVEDRETNVYGTGSVIDFETIRRNYLPMN